MILRRSEGPQEVLSAEEIEALYGEEESSAAERDDGASGTEARADSGAESGVEARAGSGSGPSPELAPGARDVLVVVRSRQDGRFLEDELRRLGHRGTVIRDPFRALDELRAARRDIILTDVDLWADDGALLFDRLRAAEDPTPVVFIGDSGERLRRRARRAGAADVLARPLRPEDLGACLRAVAAVENRGAAEAAPRERVPSARSVGLDPAAPWLRFFYEVRRELRGVRGRRARLDVVLAGICRWLRAVAVVEVEEDGAGAHLSVRACSPAHGARAAAAGRLAETVRGALAGESPLCPLVGARGTVVLPVRGRDGPPGWMVIELGQSVPPAAEPFVEELAKLLEDEVGSE